MRFHATVIPTATGTYGPFKDDPLYGNIGNADLPQPRTIPFVAVIGTEGGETVQATCAEGVDVSTIPLMKQTELAFEVYRSDGKLKLRCHGLPTTMKAAA